MEDYFVRISYTLKHFQMLKTNFSLEVHWDGDNTVDVLIDETFKNRTCGLCGNFNGNDSDDFKNPNGTLVSIAYNVIIFIGYCFANVASNKLVLFPAKILDC